MPDFLALNNEKQLDVINVRIYNPIDCSTKNVNVYNIVTSCACQQMEANIVLIVGECRSAQ